MDTEYFIELHIWISLFSLSPCVVFFVNGGTMWSKSPFIRIYAIPEITLQAVSLLDNWVVKPHQCFAFIWYHWTLVFSRLGNNWKIKFFLNATLCRIWPRVRRRMAGLRDIFSATSYCATHSAPYRVTKLIVYGPIFHDGEESLLVSSQTIHLYTLCR